MSVSLVTIGAIFLIASVGLLGWVFPKLPERNDH